MHLINVQSLQLEEFWDEKTLSYAILSHKWEDGEVSFRDMQSPAGRSKKGFVKIQQAWSTGSCGWLQSSAELSEAINSMYRWYQHSAVCYAYLYDVRSALMDSDCLGSFRASAWFLRGWTLQELLAPERVVFFDQDWRFLGTKQTLSAAIGQVTGIDDKILSGESIFKRSIAQRMSWAANRVTTRTEDTAYCLLGLFNVNMPMLYGEGTRAFLRLQEEIIRQSDDHTIFASESQPGLLAQSPAAFKDCGHVRSVGSRRGRPAYSMTNRGLSIKLHATPFSVDTYLVALDCVDHRVHTSDAPIERYRMGMFLRRLDEDDQYIRVKHGDKTFVQLGSSRWENTASQVGRPSCPSRLIEINVRQELMPDSRETSGDPVNGFRLSPELLRRGKKGEDLFQVLAASWNAHDGIMSMPEGHGGTVGHINISAQSRKIGVITLGFDFDYNPVCYIAESDELGEKWGKHAEWTSHPGIHQRSCFEPFGWSIVQGHTAMELRQHSGLWALKGDRVKGLFVKLNSRNTTVKIRRGKFENRMVWDVFIGNMRDNKFSSMQPTLKKEKSSQDLSEQGENGSRKIDFKMFK